MLKIKTRPETNWQNYLIKAGQFMETARDAFTKENWNSVGLNAVHVVISANDALTVYLSGVRAAGEKHADAAELLMQCSSDKQEAAKFLKHYSWLIGRKNLVEYESRLFYKKEAEECIKHAERFLEWARDKLGR